MDRLTENKIVLIVRETRLDGLVAKYNTVDQARFYVEHLGVDFGDYLEEHDRYKQSVTVAETTLRQLGRVQVLDRRYLPNFVFGRDDTVVVVGQDGLVANTLKYLNAQRVIGVNPDPARWDGKLLPFRVEDLRQVVSEVFQGRRRVNAVTMGIAALTDGQTLYAVNDFFIGAKTHVSAQYRIDIAGQSETQSSSGIIVSTGLGATGWLRSILMGATRIAGAIKKTNIPIGKSGRVPWDAEHLIYSVREPFPSRTTGTSLVFGKISDSAPMEIESHMAENGVIFSDGIEQDFLAFNAGMRATIAVAEKRGHLVV